MVSASGKSTLMVSVRCELGSLPTVAAGVLAFAVSVAVTVPRLALPETALPPLLQCIVFAEPVVSVCEVQVMFAEKPVPARVTGGNPCPVGRE
jgi:hypothetical protein